MGALFFMALMAILFFVALSLILASAVMIAIWAVRI